MKLGVNVFSLRHELQRNEKCTWLAVKDAGCDSIELMAYSDASVALSDYDEEKRKYIIKNFLYFLLPYEQLCRKKCELEKIGLDVSCIHVSFNRKNMLDPVAYAKELCKLHSESGIKNFVIGSPELIENIEGSAAAISDIAHYLYSRDIKLIYHAHDKEWARFGNSTYMDYLLQNCKNLYFEPDVGWIYFAGQDVGKILERHMEKIAFIHLKDLKIVENKPVFTAIGQGDVPIKDTLRFAKENNFLEKLIIDQDESDDIIRDLKVAKDFIYKAIQ